MIGEYHPPHGRWSVHKGEIGIPNPYKVWCKKNGITKPSQFKPNQWGYFQDQLEECRKYAWTVLGVHVAFTRAYLSSSWLYMDIIDPKYEAPQETPKPDKQPFFIPIKDYRLTPYCHHTLFLSIHPSPSEKRRHKKRARQAAIKALRIERQELWNDCQCDAGIFSREKRKPI